MADVDTIVIGSGAGGLTAAVALARAGQQVLVLEQHYLPGGWCHSFSLEGHQFSPGVHYIGGLNEEGAMRRIYEGLGMANDLVFHELNPDGFDHIRVGNEQFDIPRGRDAFADRLKERFPSEVYGIDAYFRTIQKLADQLSAGMGNHGILDAVTLPWRIRTILRHGFTSLDRFLDRFTNDQLLRAILSMQAGDHGVGPQEVPTVIHAAVQSHYFDGAWYPRGGAKAIPRAYIRQLRAHGGELRLRAGVAKILLENRRAIGVVLDDGTTIRAKSVISNADPAMTYGKLVGEEHLPASTRRKLDRGKWSLSALSLFLAADIDARAAGMDSGNLWYSKTRRIQDFYDLAERPGGLDGIDLPGAFLTCTTLKDPTKLIQNTHTFESFCFVNYGAFEKWARTRVDNRPEDYATLKAELTEKMLNTIDIMVPGLKERVTFAELWTPLTNEFYCGSHRGNLYGLHKTARQIGPFAFSVRSPIDNLYLCGASTLAHGVAGASFSGIAAAKQILGVSRREILSATGDLKLYPAERPEEWLDEANVSKDALAGTGSSVS